MQGLPRQQHKPKTGKVLIQPKIPPNPLHPSINLGTMLMLTSYTPTLTQNQILPSLVHPQPPCATLNPHVPPLVPCINRHLTEYRLSSHPAHIYPVSSSHHQPIAQMPISVPPSTTDPWPLLAPVWVLYFREITL